MHVDHVSMPNMSKHYHDTDKPADCTTNTIHCQGMQCCAETERYEQLVQEARKKKREKLVRQKPHAKPPVKPIPDQDELEKARAAVQKRENALKRAKTKEQKAQQELRRKKLLEQKKIMASNAPDTDEGMYTVKLLVCSSAMLCGSLSAYSPATLLHTTT